MTDHSAAKKGAFGIEDDLVARCLDGRATADDVAILASRLRSDGTFRDQWLELSDLDALLSQACEPASIAASGWWSGNVALAGSEPGTDLERSELLPHRRSVQRALPFAASLASAVVGVFFASAVWATLMPLPAMVLAIFTESFEDCEPPAVTGVPVTTIDWSGDYSELVGARDGIIPCSGNRMLRFLRGDFAGKPIEEGELCNVHRLIDLRPYKQKINKGNAVIQMSARFNGAAAAIDGRERCIVAGCAVDAETATDGSLGTRTDLLKRSLSFAFSRDVGLDADTATWQTAACELRLPPNTEFLLFSVGMMEDEQFGKGSLAVFSGHYCDDVRISLIDRPITP